MLVVVEKDDLLGKREQVMQQRNIGKRSHAC